MQETNSPPFTKIVLALNQHRLAVTIKFSIIAIAVVALYFQDLSMVFKGALIDQSTFQILAIPFIFAYLLFRKRKMISAALPPQQTNTRGFQKYFSTLTGITLFAVAILTYWYGSYTFTPIEYHMLTLPFLAAGLTLILFNLQTLKQLLFPIAFLIFLTPPPDIILFNAGSALANLSASASNTLANAFGLHAAFSNNLGNPVITLTRPDHTILPFTVDIACSGVYSLVGFIIFALFIAYITRGKLRNKFAILIMGIPLIVALNIIRITTVLAIAYNFGEDVALQLFHTVGATILMFIGTLLLLAISEKAFKQPKPSQPCPTCNPPPTNPTETFCTNCGKILKHPKTKLNKTDITKIAGIAIIVVMLLSIQAPVFALTQGPAQVMIQTPSGTEVNTSNALLPNITGYTLSYLYRDTAFEQQSGDDAALTYSYSTPNETASTVWVAIQIASSASPEHQWETCLINWPLSQGDQATVTQLDLRDIQIQDNPPITARYFAFQYKDTNQTEVVLYWYETATATLTVNAAGLNYITISPATASITAGGSQSYSATAYDQFGNSLGSASATYFVSSGATATGNSITATIVGSYTVTGIYNGKTTTATLNVNAAALDHITITPGTASITAGESQTYSATAFDQYGNNWSVTATYSASSGASVSSNSVSATSVDTYTVTGAYNGKTALATLAVTAGTPDHITLTPNTATIVTGGSQQYCANAYDKYNNYLGDVTESTIFTCTGASVSGNVVSGGNPGSYTVTGTNFEKTTNAQLTVISGSSGSPDSSNTGSTRFSNIGSPITYTITFSENGLPSGESWTATLSGVTKSSTTKTITFTGIESGLIFWSTQSQISNGSETRYLAIQSSGAISVPTVKSVAIVYTTQYYLTVDSKYGNASGQDWYNAGSTASFSVTSPITDETGNQQEFNGWTGTGADSYTGTNNNQTVIISSPITETANWTITHSTTLYTVAESAIILFALLISTLLLITWRKQRKKQKNTT